MENLQILFVALPVLALVAFILLLIFGKSEREITLNVKMDVDNIPQQTPEPPAVTKPKRTYKKRKPVVKAEPKPVERPKKSK